ncbi:disintegrin and metalloproteinase domain-containing protein 10 homolog [Pollicipes pollicipes]|uniref:disintegrin and metalloproteinase domain-containing protein 10 homolog n=1 Tax=Pollicipes pollicipes TaxID=41117 RepID=UPI001884D655|nr:disintegrin and metalloproteinase domain-containing protein 10 homolog [Pollicipes pollicipes]
MSCKAAEHTMLGYLDQTHNAIVFWGMMHGHPDSFVFGSVRDGVFEGALVVPPVTYYVEPAQVFGGARPAAAHSVIYSSQDVRFPNEAGRRRRFLTSRFSPAPNANPNKDQAGVCTMAIETDPMLWKYVIDKFDGDARRSRDYLISLIGSHMVYINHLYAALQFNGVYQHEGLQFQLQKLLITDEKTCAAGYKGEPSRFCPDNVDFKDYLNLQSMGDHREFCLAFAFTYRDFTESVMGFAWKGSQDIKDKFSGVCGKSGVKMMMKDGTMQKVRLSKNCGIVSILNYNERVPPIVSHLTFAHEIGHTLGSSHDLPENNKPECVPGGFNGNFIMYPYSVSGYDPNNSRFSPCSHRLISRVLDIIAEGKRRQCFISTVPSYCGNRVREPGEECDCGFSADICSDRCCYPRLLTDADRDANRSAAGCARRADTQCSARLVPASVARTCRQETDCQLRSTCNGSSSTCPPPAHKPNMTECQKGSKASCDATRGYCDVFGRCRPYRDNGPLARVRRLLFTGEGRLDMLTWLQYKWWAALLILLIAALLMALTVRCLAVHTPSSNPQLPPAHHPRDTVRHPMQALGLPRPDQVKGWIETRRAGRSVAAETPSAPPEPPPPPPPTGDADAWSETSSFEHVRQLDFPATPPGGDPPAPMASVAI